MPLDNLISILLERNIVKPIISPLAGRPHLTYDAGTCPHLYIPMDTTATWNPCCCTHQGSLR